MVGYKKFRDFKATVGLTFDEKLTKYWGVDYWRVNDAFMFYIGKESDQKVVLIDKGTATDGATVMAPFNRIIKPWGKYGNAVVVHDHLCRYKLIYVNGNGQNVDNKEIDKIFLEAMKVSGVGWMRHLLYYGVRFYDLIGKRTKVRYGH